jgi:hypothetical protein
VIRNVLAVLLLAASARAEQNAHGWRRDWNGFVENLAGADLRAQSDLAMIHSFAALTGVAGAPSIVDE